MYEVKNEAHEFVAETNDAAIAKASAFFGLDRDALVIRVLEPGEVHGLAGRSVVVAVPKDRKPPEAGPRRAEPRDRGRRNDRGGRGERGERGGRGDRGDRGDRGGRGERAARGGRERGRAPAVELSDEPSVGTVRGEALGEEGSFLLGVIERIDVGPFEISRSEEGDLVVFEVRGAAARALAGGDGRAVDALQLLVNQAAGKGDADAKRIVLDVEGNTDARESFLSRLAERVVRRAREGGRAVALDPMSGRDRRIIHLAVRDEDGVASMSIGEGRYRQVVIVPEGAPEYEDALSQAQAAAQQGD